LFGSELFSALNYLAFSGGKGRLRSRRRAWRRVEVVAVRCPKGRGYRATINPPPRMTE
jgi:hypothetical protein